LSLGLDLALGLALQLALGFALQLALGLTLDLALGLGAEECGQRVVVGGHDHSPIGWMMHGTGSSLIFCVGETA
jgi:hypothetical protein